MNTKASKTQIIKAATARLEELQARFDQRPSATTQKSLVALAHNLEVIKSSDETLFAKVTFAELTQNPELLAYVLATKAGNGLAKKDVQL